MAVAYESDGGTVFAAAANNNAVTVPLPATRPVGSLLLFIGWCRLISATITTPSGYTLLSTFTSGTASGGRIWVYGRVVDGTESAPTLVTTGATGTTGDLAGACIFCYSGVDVSGGITSALYDGTPTTTDASGTTTCTYPALSISNNNSMIVRFLARFRDATDTFTFTATWNEREDLGSTNRTGGQFHLQDKLATASGSQASVTVAPSNTTAARYLAVTAALKAQAATNWTQPVDDTLSLADNLASARGVAQAVDDTLALSDLLSPESGSSVSLDDTLSLNDATNFDRDLHATDTLALTDATAFDRDLHLTDTLTLEDALSAGRELAQAIDDGLALADLLTTQADKVLSIADTLALQDSLASQSAFLRELADTLGLADLTDPVKSAGGTDWTQPLDDTLAVADSQAMAVGHGLDLADVIGLADAQTFERAVLITIADTLDLIDLLEIAAGLARTLSDTLELTDLVVFETPSTLATVVFDAPRPVGGTDLGSPSASERDDGTPGGGMDPGDPIGTVYDNPTPAGVRS